MRAKWLIGLAGLACCVAAHAKPMNIVFFLIDDLGWVDTGVYGSTFLVTKILRMGADERVSVERFFSRYGIWSLLLSWLPLIGDPLCVVAGMMKVGFDRFAMLVLTGKTARYAAVAWATMEGRQLFL